MQLQRVSCRGKFTRIFFNFFFKNGWCFLVARFWLFGGTEEKVLGEEKDMKCVFLQMRIFPLSRSQGIENYRKEKSHFTFVV
jgi:hypothetical protein